MISFTREGEEVDAVEEQDELKFIKLYLKFSKAFTRLL